jgi:sulfate adenylyltransferase large subunit
MESLKFVIVGHVDHGKSTLIGRLLFDTDSLPPDKIDQIRKASKDTGRETEFAFILDHFEEERRQGITIDTTQVFFKTPEREYVIIDAPGHIEFVKNMITGASQAEAAILIIDAVEGVKEQTKRHAYILSLLELKQVVVVVNKMDLVGFKEEHFKKVRGQAHTFLKTLDIEPLFYIPVSAMKGDNVIKASENMSWYKDEPLIDALQAIQNRGPIDTLDLILPVQDVYRVGEKRIVAGRVESGTLAAGDSIKVRPSGQSTQVASIEKYLEKTTVAKAGESIGITTKDDIFTDRGDVICTARKEPVLTDRFHASLFWMSKRPLAVNEQILIRCATQETRCRVVSIDRRIDSSSFDILEEGASFLGNLEVGRVTIRTKRPISIKAFKDTEELGRFVFVRDEDICAGGIITDTGVSHGG